MNLIRVALRRPITIVVAVIAIPLCAALALRRMAIDIFPNFGLPVIYVAQPYGGMDPAQMEGYLVSYYEYHFLYINGIEHVESKSIQGIALIKLFFHPGTDMSQALAQTVSYVNRSKAFMPPGTVDPFIMRFDVGGAPVGQLIFSSETRSLGEIQDLALFRVRPMFSTLPGVSAPPPFGGNQRTVVVRVDPERLQAYGLSPDEVIRAVASGNTITPAGNVRIGDLTRIAPINSVVSNIQDLGTIPLRRGAGPAVYVRDVAVIENASDITTGYALVNGKRAVYIPVTKRADASTVSVVNLVKASLPKFQAAVPQDIRISFEFDQSTYVRNALRTLTTEGILGALLTGLVVMLFLKSWRSAVIVIITIPLALLSAVVALWVAGQTINVMTLGGLALAIGILVDESTVAIENIHTHLASGKPKLRAALDAALETAIPRLLAMLCIVAVFIPSVFMVGVGRALFVPLSLAVGFAMVASYFLSSTLVPILAAWILKPSPVQTNDRTQLYSGDTSGESNPTDKPRLTAHGQPSGPLNKLQDVYTGLLERLLQWRWGVSGAYLLLAIGFVWWVAPSLGTEIFPNVDTGLLQFRLKAPPGTRLERTEVMTLKALDVIRAEVGEGNILISSGFVGIQPPSYPINTIHLWTSGPHEAVMLVALDPEAHISTSSLKETLRERLSHVLPRVQLSFEPGDLVSQVMSFGSPTPIEVAVTGPNLAANRAHAEKLIAAFRQLPMLRDVQLGQSLEYPTVDVQIDRERAGQLGVTVQEVARSLVAATSSSRFVQPNYWRDPTTGVAYQVQVEVPQHLMRSIEDVQNIPTMGSGQTQPLVGDLARVSYGSTVGEYHRYNMQRMVTLTANIQGKDLGTTANAVNSAIRSTGEPPRGVSVSVRGQVAPMRETLDGLQTGLWLAVVTIFFLLAASFQSLRLGLAVISTVPAVLCGVIVSLLVSGGTLNVQSFMGTIMAVGVAVANAILLVTLAESTRKQGRRAEEAAAASAGRRLRPILMTSLAMISGMIPMALAVGEGGEQSAPLGRAVIGGLVAATFATLFVLPCVFALLQRRQSIQTHSLDPDDSENMLVSPT